VRLAERDPAGADQSLSEAVRLWNGIGAPHEAALARLTLTEALAAAGNEHRAVRRDAARAILDGIAAAPAIARPGEDRDVHGEQPAISGDSVFRRRGDFWNVIFDSRTVRVRERKGVRYFARLLVDPGREYHVLDLAAGGTDRATHAEGRSAELPRSALGDAGPIRRLRLRPPLTPSTRRGARPKSSSPGGRASG
jgi:hypothetical protein